MKRMVVLSVAAILGGMFSQSQAHALTSQQRQQLAPLLGTFVTAAGVTCVDTKQVRISINSLDEVAVEKFTSDAKGAFKQYMLGFSKINQGEHKTTITHGLIWGGDVYDVETTFDGVTLENKVDKGFFYGQETSERLTNLGNGRILIEAGLASDSPVQCEFNLIQE